MYMSILLFLLTGICAFTDMRDGRIYNAVVVPCAMLGLLLQGLPVCGGSLETLGTALARMGMMLALFVPCWLLMPGGIGGGDVKLYAAVAVMVHESVLVALVFLSLLMALLYGLLQIGRGERGRIRIGPAVFCAAVLYVGGVYG